MLSNGPCCVFGDTREVVVIVEEGHVSAGRDGVLLRSSVKKYVPGSPLRKWNWQRAVEGAVK